MKRSYRLEFPRSCVIYLRSNRNTPDSLEIEIVFPDGHTHTYQIPAIKMDNYTKDGIFEKNLLMLLPFYVMRYEKNVHDISEHPEKMRQLLNEYEEIRQKLNEELTEKGKSDVYTNLIDWITRIADYIFRDEDTARKGIDHIMRGKVLKLKSEEIREEAQKEIVISLSEMGMPIEQIIEGTKVDEKMIREWLAEKQ